MNHGRMYLFVYSSRAIEFQPTLGLTCAPNALREAAVCSSFVLSNLGREISPVYEPSGTQNALNSVQAFSRSSLTMI